MVSERLVSKNFKGLQLPMSALGQKQTYTPQKGMSALLPIATAKADFRKRPMSALPPKADMGSAFPLWVKGGH